MKIRLAAERDISAITEIYNDAVLNTTAVWNEKTVDEDNRRAWLSAHEEKDYPVLVAVDEQDEVLGYATFDDWRNWEGYRFTVEHSVYIHASVRGQGVGTYLMKELIERARAANKHVLVAGISADNIVSIKLHERLGFENVGTLNQVGVKFGNWLDLTFLQLRLNDEAAPLT